MGEARAPSGDQDAAAVGTPPPVRDSSPRSAGFRSAVDDEAGTDARPVDVYDLRGLNCPLPVLKSRRRLADMPVGRCLWIETTDPLAVIDIPAFCNEAGHRLVTSESVPGGHRFLIERGG